MTIAENTLKNIDIQEEDVVAYLQHNPNFFTKHGDLLEFMQIADKEATPFHQRQLQVLREREAKSQEKLEYLMQSVKSNQRLEDDIQAFSLALLEHRSQYDKAAREVTLSRLVKAHFRVEFATVIEKPLACVDQAEQAVFERIAHKSSVCDDRLPTSVLQFLFAQDAQEIGSCAIIPLLGKEQLRAAIALGVQDQTRFQPSLGVHYLNRIGKIASAFIFA